MHCDPGGQSKKSGICEGGQRSRMPFRSCLNLGTSGHFVLGLSPGLLFLSFFAFFLSFFFLQLLKVGLISVVFHFPQCLFFFIF